MPTALKSCPKSNKFPNQVTLLPTYLLTHIIHFSPSTQENTMFLFDKVTESKTVKLETSQTVIGTSPYIPTLYLSLVHHDNYSTISLQLSHLHSLSLCNSLKSHTPSCYSSNGLFSFNFIQFYFPSSDFSCNSFFTNFADLHSLHSNCICQHWIFFLHCPNDSTLTNCPFHIHYQNIFGTAMKWALVMEGLIVYWYELYRALWY